MHEKFTWSKQSAYKWQGDGITLYIDPWGVRKGQDEPADLIFITHAHSDHFEPEDIEKIRKPNTQFVAPRDVAEKLKSNVKAVKTDVALVCIGGVPYVMNASEAVGLVKKINPQVAIPNHFCYVIGVPSN